MTDPIAVVGTTAVGAYLAKDGLNKLLGPTCELLGDKLKTVIEKCDFNVGQVIVNAHKKANEKLDSPGGVSPRVAKNVIEEARFIDEKMAVEYFGGVLASSRSEVENDERGLMFITSLKSMSSIEIKLHYLFYLNLKTKYKSDVREISVSQTNMANKISLKVKTHEILRTFSMEYNSNSCLMILNSIDSLKRLGLLSEQTNYRYSNDFSKNSSPNIQVYPTVYGINLFLWANGLSEISPNKFFTEKLEICPFDGCDNYISEKLIPNRKVQAQIQARISSKISNSETIYEIGKHDKVEVKSGLVISLQRISSSNEVFFKIDSQDLKFDSFSVKETDHSLVIIDDEMTKNQNSNPKPELSAILKVSTYSPGIVEVDKRLYSLELLDIKNAKASENYYKSRRNQKVKIDKIVRFFFTKAKLNHVLEY